MKLRYILCVLLSSFFLIGSSFADWYEANLGEKFGNFTVNTDFNLDTNGEKVLYGNSLSTTNGQFRNFFIFWNNGKLYGYGSHQGSTAGSYNNGYFTKFCILNSSNYDNYQTYCSTIGNYITLTGGIGEYLKQSNFDKYAIRYYPSSTSTASNTYYGLCYLNSSLKEGFCVSMYETSSTAGTYKTTGGGLNFTANNTLTYSDFIGNYSSYFGDAFYYVPSSPSSSNCLTYNDIKKQYESRYGFNESICYFPSLASGGGLTYTKNNPTIFSGFSDNWILGDLNLGLERYINQCLKSSSQENCDYSDMIQGDLQDIDYKRFFTNYYLFSLNYNYDGFMAEKTLDYCNLLLNTPKDYNSCTSTGDFQITVDNNPFGNDNLVNTPIVDNKRDPDSPINIIIQDNEYYNQIGSIDGFWDFIFKFPDILSDFYHRITAVFYIRSGVPGVLPSYITISLLLIMFVLFLKKI